jgi:hypothetical protein
MTQFINPSNLLSSQEQPQKCYIYADTLFNVVENKLTNEFPYSNLISSLKEIINNAVITELDNSGIHLIKSDHPIRMNRMVKIYLNKHEKRILPDPTFTQHIIRSIKEDCGEDQVVVFWDFLRDIDIYHTNNPLHNMYESNNIPIGIFCSYDIINKNHYSITPSKNMVRTLIDNNKI